MGIDKEVCCSDSSIPPDKCYCQDRYAVWLLPNALTFEIASLNPYPGLVHCVFSGRCIHRRLSGCGLRWICGRPSLVRI
jgi:hypothetical protein